MNWSMRLKMMWSQTFQSLPTRRCRSKPWPHYGDLQNGGSVMWSDEEVIVDLSIGIINHDGY